MSDDLFDRDIPDPYTPTEEPESNLKAEHYPLQVYPITCNNSDGEPLFVTGYAVLSQPVDGDQLTIVEDVTRPQAEFIAWNANKVQAPVIEG